MNKPLSNVKVVVTRAKEQAVEFADILKKMGAEVIFFPTIKFEEPDNLTIVNKAIQSLSDNKNAYDWLIFTSANGVRFFFKRVKALGKEKSVLSNLKVGVVGPKTAEILREEGVHIDLIPKDYSAEGLISGLLREGISGKKILIPRARYGREILPGTLRANGAKVTLISVYRTVAPDGIDKGDILKATNDDSKVILTFTSGSTVKNFFKLFDEKEKKFLKNKAKIAVISPVTAKAVEKMKFHVDIVPKVFTTKDLADEIANFNKRT